MTHLAPIPTLGDLVAPDVVLHLPASITTAGPQAERRFFEFFAAQLANANAPAAYARAAMGFRVHGGVRHAHARRP